MADFVEVCGRVLMRGAVAAPDVTTDHAEPKVHPRAAHAQAVLAPVGACGDFADLVEVAANFRHSNQRTTARGPLAGTSILIPAACVAEGDPVAHHLCPAEQASSLHRVLAEAIADRVDRGLQALIPGPNLTCEPPHLTGIRLRQPSEAHPH